jgi:epoxyqueuosine reductase
MTAAELTLVGAELGLDAVGASPAEPYEETERHIRDRRERGLFAGMGFTTRRPEVSCHPEALVPGARTVISAALCYYAPLPRAKTPEGALRSTAPTAGVGEGMIARYAWSDRYEELRGKLDALGHRLGGSYRVLVDENDHVDREAAARAGIGFYGKNTLLITRRHGSWVVLGTLVSDQVVEPSPPLDAGCGSCRLCIDACPTGALDDPGTLDSNLCLSYWTQAPSAVPEPYREPLGSLVYGCDICQEACPWNRGIEKRRADHPLPAEAEPVVSLVEWLEADGVELVERYDRLYIPRNDPRWLRRNALIAAGNVGGPAERDAVARYAEDEDDLLREHAEWALARIDGRSVA